MVLEATMICIDNSEWMRNGDYSPSRLQAQADAVNLICCAKTQSNPGNTVGILTMAGRRVRVLTTPTSDLGKILACMHGIEASGEMNIAAGIQVAQLVLKHRQNKNQRQRIIVFVGSPIKYEKKALEIIGKKLKKSNVSLDIINFGDKDDGKPEKLEALLSAVNNNDSSHIIHVPPAPNALADMLISTFVFIGDEGAGYAAAGGDFDFVDPYLDPELEHAIRVSMEEQIARQEAVAKWALEEFYRGEASSNSQDATMVDSTIITAAEATDTAPDGMEEVLQQAFVLSMHSPGSDPSAKDVDMSDAVSDDKDLAIALQMSMQDDQGALSGQSDMSKVLEDQAFMSSILASLPGVEPVIALLASLHGQSEPEEKKNEDKPPNDDK